MDTMTILAIAIAVVILVSTIVVFNALIAKPKRTGEKARSHFLHPVLGSGETPFQWNANVTRSANKDRSPCGRCGVGRKDS